jgi:hypothetical protein
VTAKQYPDRGFKRMYWAAVRSDVLANKQALHHLRTEIAADLSTSMLASLSDVRLLDILSWSR